MTATALRQIADDVARELASTEHLPNMSVIRTPLLYPDGATVLVQLSRIDDRYIVTDAGDAHLQADMCGASFTLVRQAKSAAERAGIEFEGHAFVIGGLDREQLVGAVMTVANCAKEAMDMTVYEIARKRHADARERLLLRLGKIFAPEQLTKDAILVGSSNHEWKITALVQSNSHRTVFEPVSDNLNSIYRVHTEFVDLARIDDPPVRVAVVRNKRALGDRLNLLAQAGRIIDEDVGDATWRRQAA